MAKKKIEYTDEQLREILLKKAKDIHNQPIEHAYTIEQDGIPYKCPAGTDGTVDIPEEKAKTAIIILHNHPHEFKEPSTFSGKDVYNLLYYRLNEIIVCSYGKYFSMKNAGCPLLSSQVMNLLDKEYKRLNRILYKKYVETAENTPAGIAANYKKYLTELEREYAKYMKQFALEKNLMYFEGEL